MAKYKVAMNGQTGEFEVHSATCPDPKRPEKRRDYTGPAWTREAESGQAALDEELADDFDGGSFKEAGFTGRVFPCAGRK